MKNKDWNFNSCWIIVHIQRGDWILIGCIKRRRLRCCLHQMSKRCLKLKDVGYGPLNAQAC